MQPRPVFVSVLVRSLLLGCFLAASGFAFSQTAPAGLSRAQIAAAGLLEVQGEPEAPDFTLSGPDGKPVTLSSLRGKVVLLNFWATWCPPCREEMPSMETLYQAFKGRSDFVMLAVSSQETKATVDQFLKKTPYNFPILLDTRGEVSSMYSVSAIPTTYLIDARGIVIAGKVGGHDWSTQAVARELGSLLAPKK